MSAGLKLRARDAEDLEAISACVQDSLVSLCDMTFLPEQNRFVMLVNRFCWEKNRPATSRTEEREAEDREPQTRSAESGPMFERVHCGLCFDRVLSARAKGIDWRARDRIFALLAIRAQGNKVFLFFAGGPTIELTIGALRCHLEDVGEGWPTHWCPQHSDLEQGERAP